jgi:hypothetical protein
MPTWTRICVCSWECCCCEQYIMCTYSLYTCILYSHIQYTCNTRMPFAYTPISKYALCSHPICLCNACKQAVCMYSMSQACFYTIRQYVVHKYAHALYIHYTQTRPKHTRTLHSWSQVSAQQNKSIKLWTETMGWFTKYLTTTMAQCY